MAVVGRAGVIHRPVLTKEAIDFLKIKPDGVYVDGTLGTGGHALAILEKLGPAGLLIGLDRDEEALSAAKERLQSVGKQVRIHHENFKNMRQVLEREKCPAVDGILLDLGLSTLQIEMPERGFSFGKEGPLDMRMDFSQGETAGEKIKQSQEQELAEVLEKYGEERYAKKMARKIAEKMKRGEIKNTLDLARIARETYPRKAQWKGIHPATRLFQAVRIWVNEELENLKDFLKIAPPLLKSDGRLCILSYHSLEDRLVKHSFRRLAQEDENFEVMTKKPVSPSEEEVRQNPRSRSAKLRALRKKG